MASDLLKAARRQLNQRLETPVADETKGKGKGNPVKKARRKKAPAPKLSGVEKAQLNRKAKDNTAHNLRFLK